MRAPGFTRRDFFRWSAAGAFSSIVPLALAEGETRSLRIEPLRLALSQWDAPGMRVALLADVHINRPIDLSLATQAAAAAIDQKPDLILLPGDFVNFSDSLRIGQLRTFLQAFADAKCPVFATLGNHDYAAARPQRIVAAFAGTPVRLLRNETAEVGGVTVAGFDDALAHLFRPDFLTPGSESRSLIAMLHEPDYVAQVPSHVSLQVSGHSHGGQVCLPGGYPLDTPYGARTYFDGFYPDAKVPLFVTRGVGTTGAPFRFCCPPQVAILTLESA